jgi:hypothetical protein
VHAKFSACSGDFARVFDSNLNDVCAPAPGVYVRDLTGAYARFLRDVREFACAIRRTSTLEFDRVCRGSDDPGRIPPELRPFVRAVRKLGFTVSRASLSALAALVRPGRTFDASSTSTVPSRDEAVDFQRAMRVVGGEGVVMSMDKNSGMGAVVCPNLYWHVLRSSLWDNVDYVRAPFSSNVLLLRHLTAYTDGSWQKIARFKMNGTPANIPFLF